jgi:hypothetical protein
MTDVEEKYQLSIEAGEKAYNDSEGNLEYALEAALQHFAKSLVELTNTSVAESD